MLSRAIALPPRRPWCRRAHAVNAMDGCKEAGIDADALRKAWAVAKKGGKLVKPGGGF